MANNQQPQIGPIKIPNVAITHEDVANKLSERFQRPLAPMEVLQLGFIVEALAAFEMCKIEKLQDAQMKSIILGQKK